MVYTYDLSFDNAKNWLPQTTEKIIKYLENTIRNTKKINIENFKIENTKWKVCLKPKNDKAGLQLNKVVKKEEVFLDNIDKFKKILELSHLVEIHLKAIFDKIAYTSKSISYSSFKNQHEYIIQKEKLLQKNNLIAQRANKFFSANELVKNNKLLFSPNDLEINQGKILNAIYFEFIENNNQFVLGFNNQEDIEDEIYTLYSIDHYNKNIILKYFFAKDIAKEIYKINDFAEHNISNKKIKRIINLDLKNYNFKK